MIIAIGWFLGADGERGRHIVRPLEALSLTQDPVPPADAKGAEGSHQANIWKNDTTGEGNWTVLTLVYQARADEGSMCVGAQSCF